MRSETSEQDLLPALDALVREHAAEIFDGAGAQPVEPELTITGRLLERGDRHHRVLTVRHGASSKRVWLKFRSDFRELYEIHRATWNGTQNAPLFPRPYFHAEIPPVELLAMEYLEGRPLRELLLRRAATRRARSLDRVFGELGTRLRVFHDASEATSSKPVRDIAANARRLAKGGDDLIEQISGAESRAGADTALPLIKIHHDCSLRNMIVTGEGEPRLVDLDSMRAAPDSRWYDIATLLINLESQAKYAPVVSARAVAPAWRAFWRSYLDGGPPDGLSIDAAHALLYLTKVEYLLGGTFRPPLFEVYTGRIAARYLRRLERALVAGEPFTYGEAWAV
jgi:hypothetical protein